MMPQSESPCASATPMPKSFAKVGNPICVGRRSGARHGGLIICCFLFTLRFACGMAPTTITLRQFEYFDVCVQISGAGKVD